MADVGDTCRLEGIRANWFPGEGISGSEEAGEGRRKGARGIREKAERGSVAIRGARGESGRWGATGGELNEGSGQRGGVGSD